MIDALNKIVVATALAVAITAGAWAQQAGEGDKSDRIAFTPTGRALVDAACYVSHDEQFKAGAAIPEARLGIRGDYRDWAGRVEVGVSYGKLALKDIWVQKQLTDNLWLRVGNFIQPFGLQSTYNASMKSTMEMPTSNSAFDLSRQIGVRVKYLTAQMYSALAVGVESQSSLLTPADMGHSGWGVTGRWVWRAGLDGDGIVQVGVSGAYQTPTYHADGELNHKAVDIVGRFPTSVSRVTAINALVDNARGYLRLTPELLLMKGRVALESQYYHGHVWRSDCNDYDGYGAYAILRGIVKGPGYQYRPGDARLETPSGGSLELSLCYNYTCLSDRSAEIWGGRVSDISCTLNWYINRYVIWRVRAGYSHSWQRLSVPDVSLTAFQTRLQIIF